MDLIERVAEWEIRHYKGTLIALFVVALGMFIYGLLALGADDSYRMLLLITLPALIALLGILWVVIIWCRRFL
jgi:hypothetical protein